MRRLPQNMWILLQILLLSIIVNSDYSHLQTIDDMIAYKISFKSNSDEEVLHTENEDAKRWVTMMSADQEEYHCLLPSIQTDSKKRIESYSGPTPSELLQPLYDEGYCSYRIETYWMYELCHGRYVMQYHEEKDTKSRTEFYLGNFDKTQADAEDAKFDQLNPPTRKFEEEKLPYYPITFNQGTICDLTNKPRQTMVMYVCDETAKGTFHMLNEISSCNYEIVVMTNRLCAHPSFQPSPNNEHDIRCYATNAQASNPKPRALLSNERESTSDFMKEFTTVKSFDNKNLFTRLVQADENSAGMDQLNIILDALKASTVKKSGSNIEMPPKPVVASDSDRRIVDMFWDGRACFTGGYGKWKYEICHGRSVIQYKNGLNGERTEITLGVFHKDIHNQWASQNSHKARKVDNGKVYRITNLYSNGDICPETNAHRSCEVRIRCQEQASPSKILLYLMEPKTCSYILVMESPLFCDTISKADENGLLPDMPDLNAFIGVEEARKISHKTQNSIEVFKLEDLTKVATANPYLPNGLTPIGNEAAADDGGKAFADNTGNEKPTAKRILTDIFDELINGDTVLELVQNLENFDEIVIKKDVNNFADDDSGTSNGEATDEEEDDEKASSKRSKLSHDEN